MKFKEILGDPRRRVILITIASSAILLILIVALIVTMATGKKPAVSTETTNVAISDPVKTDDPADKNTTPVDNSNNAGIVTVLPTEKDTTKTEKTEKTEKTTKTDTTSKKDLPKTGPEDALPVALLAGSLVAFMLSRRQKSTRLA